MHVTMKRGPARTALIAMVLSTLAGCAVGYSGKAYDRAIATRHKTVLLLDKAKDDDSARAHKSEIAALRADYAKAVEAEQAREGVMTRNTESINIWKSISKLVQRPLALWEKQGKLNIRFINSFKDELHKSFKDLLDLEQAKKGAPAKANK